MQLLAKLSKVALNPMNRISDQHTHASISECVWLCIEGKIVILLSVML